MADPKKARRREYIDFGKQPGPYLAGGGQKEPVLFQAVLDHRGYGEKWSYGIFKTADYPSAEDARKAAEAVLDERKRDGERVYYIETVYAIPEPERWVRAELRDGHGKPVEIVEGPASDVAKRVAAFTIAQGSDPDGEQPRIGLIAGRVEIIPMKTPKSAYIRV